MIHFARQGRQRPALAESLECKCRPSCVPDKDSAGAEIEKSPAAAGQQGEGAMDQWQNFLLAEVGASEALTGLVFVGVYR